MDQYQSGLSELCSSWNSVGPVKSEFLRIRSTIDKRTGSVADKQEREKIKAAIAREEIEKNSKINAKILIMKEVVKRVESHLQPCLKAINGEKFNISLYSTATVSLSGDSFCLNTSAVVNNGKYTNNYKVPMHLNIEKLLSLPLEEVYAVLTTMVYSSLANAEYIDKQKLGDGREEKLSFGKEVDEDEPFTSEEAESILYDYFQGFLSDYEPLAAMSKEGQVLDQGAIAGEVARLISRDFVSSVGPTAAVKMMFGSQLKSKAEAAAKDLGSKRVRCLIDRSQEALNAGYESRATGGRQGQVPLGYSEQATELLSTQTKNAFNSIKQTDDLQATPDVMNFCQSYIKSFLGAYGIKDYHVEFGTFGTPGEFVPGNGAGTIKIDVNQAKSITDLVMTMSHEATHLVEQAGVSHRRGADFDWNDLENSGLTKGTPEHDLLKKLDDMCYHLDQDERHGRIGELSALEFMSKMAGDNENLKQDVANNIASYKAYQKQTIEMGEGLNKAGSQYSIQQIEAEFNAIKGKLARTNPAAYKMIETRIKYLKDLSADMDLSSEYESMKAVDGMGSGKTNSAPENATEGLTQEEIEQIAQQQME